MRSFTRRRWKNALLLLAGVGLLCAMVTWLDASLWRTAHMTGYTLYGTLVLLAAYNVRKKLPGLPLGSSSTWLQIHLIVGVGTLPLLLLHTGGRWPDGWVESLLALLFAATYVSGVVGLYLTRTIPVQLSRTGEQFVYERIPRLKHAVRAEARSAVLTAVHETGATTLADYYSDRLHGFFQRPRSLAYGLRPTSATRKRLFEELDAVRRFLTEGERQACERLFALVRKKDDLDFHESRQRVLKLWIFFHIAATCALLLLGAGHGLLATAFQGGPA